MTNNKRLIASLFYKDGLLVQSVGFKKFLPIGKPNFTIDLISRWDIDEIFLINISNNRIDKKLTRELISSFSKKCFVPLTVGGGVDNIEYAKNIISCGADKVLINSAAITYKKLINQIARVLGSQCVVVGIDVKKNKEKYQIYKNSGNDFVDLEINSWIKEIEELGAGEILINSIDRDGSKKGYDLNFLKQITYNPKIPLIMQGGAGRLNHIKKIIKNKKLSACAIGNMFHFSEHSTIITKSFLKRKGVNIRFDNLYNYKKKKINDKGRVLPNKYDDYIKINEKPSQKHLI